MDVRKRWWVGAAAVAALVVAVSIVVTAQGPPAPDATTAKPVTPAPVPTEPRRAAWTWQVPGAAQDPLYARSDDSEDEGPAVDEVAAAGAGVVVLTNDGLTALDGRTGKERWHYRVPDAEGTNLLTSPRGGWVVLGYDDGDDDDDGERHLVALDAMTGRPGMRITPAGEGTVWRAADGVLVADAAAVTSGYDMRTGKRLWSYRLPRGCLRSPRRVEDRGTIARDAMVLGTVCAPAPGKSKSMIGTLRVLALDARTGRQVWSHHETVPKEDSSGLAWAFRDLELESSPDGRFVSIQRWDDTLLDASSGKALLDPEAMSEGEVREYGSDWVVVGHYTGEAKKRRYRTVRIDLDDGSRTPATHPLLRPGGIGAAKTLAGDRMLGLSEPRSSEDETEDGVKRVLSVVEGEPLPRLEVDLGPSTDADDDLTQCGSDLLVAAPGAIVAGCTDATRLVGLT